MCIGIVVFYVPFDIGHSGDDLPSQWISQSINQSNCTFMQRLLKSRLLTAPPTSMRAQTRQFLTTAWTVPVRCPRSSDCQSLDWCKLPVHLTNHLAGTSKTKCNYNQITTQKPKQQLLQTTNISKTKPKETKARKWIGALHSTAPGAHTGLNVLVYLMHYGCYDNALYKLTTYLLTCFVFTVHCDRLPYHTILGRRGLDLQWTMLRPIRMSQCHAMPEWERRVGSVSRCRWCAATATFAVNACG